MASKTDKRLMRIAQKLRTAFEQRMVGSYKAIFELFPDLLAAWRGLSRTKTRVDKSDFKPTQEGMREARRLLRQLRGYVSSVKNNSRYLLQRIDSCVNELDDTTDSSNPIALPTLTDCYKQVKALEAEFGHCELAARANLLTTRSHEVQLDNITFGRYFIHIELARLAQNHRGFYRVVPVSAECPTVGESTHPHLMSERLCEGNGRSAIDKAFADGRLYDCCLLINSILQTYGSGPYVELEQFGSGGGHEYSCEECGAGLGEDETFCCDSCERTMCRDCVSHCGANDNWICESCTDAARSNNEPCVSSCTMLGAHHCDVRENERCPECNDIYPDSQLAKCEIITTEPQLCEECAKGMAESREHCDSCLMHGHMGCALTRFDYPTLNTLNHPAYVTARGRQHRHHGLGWHPAGLFHPAQTEGEPSSDFQAYGQFLDRRRGQQHRRDYTRSRQAGQTTATRQQLAAFAEENS